MNEIKFSRPYLQEESELAAEWSYPTTFKNIPFTIIIQLLSAILLEKKILIISSNLRYLSSFILSIKPLIRPYVYQSIITPIIPLKMVHLLEAPVPFVVGMTTLPSRDLIPSDVIVFDLLNNQFRTPYQIPLLPNAAILYPFFSYHFIYVSHFIFIFFLNWSLFLKIRKGNARFI